MAGPRRLLGLFCQSSTFFSPENWLGFTGWALARCWLLAGVGRAERHHACRDFQMSLNSCYGGKERIQGKTHNLRVDRGWTTGDNGEYWYQGGQRAGNFRNPTATEISAGPKAQAGLTGGCGPAGRWGWPRGAGFLASAGRGWLQGASGKTAAGQN